MRAPISALRGGHPYEQMRTKMPHAFHYNVPSLSLSPRQLHDGLMKLLPITLRKRVKATFDASNPINKVLNVYFERTEERAIRRECLDYHLEHNSAAAFVRYLLHAYIADPSLLDTAGDSSAQNAEIRTRCAQVSEALAKRPARR